MKVEETNKDRDYKKKKKKKLINKSQPPSVVNSIYMQKKNTKVKLMHIQR